ncbi:MET14, partial [Symbiodinium sp. CCMP2456]
MQLCCAGGQRHIFQSSETESGLQAVVWICSFALWQHGDVSASLSSLDRCPFAVSMRAVHRVLVLTDNSAETLERCWVVFEAALAHELRKDYNICLPDDGDADCWNIVGRKLERVDVEACKASNQKDKQ